MNADDGAALTGLATEDQARSAVIGTLARELRIEWTWSPTWTPEDITPEGREQLTAIGFSFGAMKRTA